MNYLAHIHLSGESREVAVGNFIGDGVKGKLDGRYPPLITVGLKLHRFIDSTADTHPVNTEARRALYADFGKYAGVVQDMLHDHFLSKHWGQFGSLPIRESLALFYAAADEQLPLFPAHQRSFYLAMREGSWLVNYGELDGIGRALRGISQRISAENTIHRAPDYLESNYARLERDFFAFYPILEEECAKELQRLLTKL